MSKRLQVQVWSDIACPWCYVGKRRFESALARFDHAAEVEIVWRAFELDPSAPRSQPKQDYAQRLASKYGQTRAQAQARIEQLVALAQADGVTLDFTRIQPGNTFDAHRLIHLALDRGKQGAVKERLLRAYLSEGEAIGAPEALLRLTTEAGLEPDEVQAVLATDQYAREVRADETQARELGIHGVPFFVVAQRYAIEGAQPAELILSALERAWSELSPLVSLSAPDAAVCGPDGCGPAADGGE
ncbi:MAG TPA: DsbA family oxidoreductase [Polyangiales bacterium]